MFPYQNIIEWLPLKYGFHTIHKMKSLYILLYSLLQSSFLLFFFYMNEKQRKKIYRFKLSCMISSTQGNIYVGIGVKTTCDFVLLLMQTWNLSFNFTYIHTPPHTPIHQPKEQHRVHRLRYVKFDMRTFLNFNMQIHHIEVELKLLHFN